MSNTLLRIRHLFTDCCRILNYFFYTSFCLWHEPDMAQFPQLHPHEDLPFFLSPTIFRIINVSTAAKRTATTMVPILAIIHAVICHLLYNFCFFSIFLNYNCFDFLSALFTTALAFLYSQFSPL